MALKQAVLYLLILLSISGCKATNISEDDDIELDEQLKLLNKPPVKTFLTEEGDTIDCVDIDKQPALDHPLLKNHKVQRKPKLPLGSFTKAPPGTKHVQFRPRQRCPVGTVPIQRTKKEDLIRTRSLPKMPNTDQEFPGQHRVTLWHPGLRKYGARAFMSVYNLTVEEDQFVEHTVSVSTGPLDRYSMIIAGWHVSPVVNGDHLTRMFTYWTGNSWQNGCYNTMCRGFVQVDQVMTPNFPIKPVSTLGGPMYELRVEIAQDKTTGNWWLRVYNTPINVGYWPKELFVNLQDGTFSTAWGGLARESANGFCPPMGNGLLPNPDMRKAAYFRTVEWLDADGGSYSPDSNARVEVDAPPGSYGLADVGVREPPWEYYFSIGGPGGYCKE